MCFVCFSEYEGDGGEEADEEGGAAPAAASEDVENFDHGAM